MVLITGHCNQRGDLGCFTRRRVLLAEETRVGNHVLHLFVCLWLCRQRAEYRCNLLLVVGSLRHPGASGNKAKGH